MSPSSGTRRRPSALTVVVTDARGRNVAGGAALGRWLAAAAPARARGTVALAIVSDRHMRTLNRGFRGVDAPTDVLSFPAGEPELDTAVDTRSKASRNKHLGDLAIARGVAARQARTEGHAVTTELKILALHGLLHLLGYDHERDRGEMRIVEERLRTRAGLPLGLIARAPRPTTTR